jgi:brefeldin A-inhibited guanine nucleotide-exchange protein
MKKIEKGDLNVYFGISEEIWLKLLGSLATLASDPRPAVQSQSLTNLFRLLSEFGDNFPKEFWQMIISAVIKPLFDEIQYSMQSKKNVTREQIQSFRDFCDKAFSELIKLYQQYFTKLRHFTENLFAIIINCIQNPQEALAKVSVSNFKKMVDACSEKFSNEEWENIVLVIQKIVTNTTPTQLLESKHIEPPSMNEKEKQSLKFNSAECITQCVVQLFMVSVIKEFTEKYYDKFTDQQIEKLLEILETSYKFARTFNDQIYLRYCLWKNGFNQDMTQLPGLLKQEKESLSVYLSLIHASYLKKEVNSSARKQQLNRFLDYITKVMTSYATKHEEFIDHLKKDRLEHKDKHDKHEKQEKHEKQAKVDQSRKSVQSMAQLTDDKEKDKQENHHSEEDTFDITLRKLKLHELERDIANLRSLLSGVIIPKLSTIDIVELTPRLKEIVQALLHISSYSFQKCYACFSDIAAINCPKTVDAVAENTDIAIKALLNKYFEFCFNQIHTEKVL